jgi:signal transduction histidine kinase
MIQGRRQLTLGLGLMVFSFLAGLVATALWLGSARAWDRYLTHAQITGIVLHDALRTGRSFPTGVTATPLSAVDQAAADAGDFGQLQGLPRPTLITNISIRDQSSPPQGDEVMTVVIISNRLRYSVAELGFDEGEAAAQKFGALTRLLATYCSDPILVVRMQGSGWMRVDGAAVWGCDAAPRDLRLLGAALAILALSILGTATAENAAHYDRFARALRGRRRLGGPESYTVDGPAELREIVSAVNSYLEDERDQLSKRAIVLSGVSHDLGTPATRLRLRAALIPDQDLRQKFEADIDRMTGMIESVLTYTRSELNVEEPRQISLTSLVEALVFDYQDVGKPVDLRPPEARTVEGGGSVFSTARRQSNFPELHKILVAARPLSLQRAVSNLIDNALKYGRRATLELSANAETALIVVEDEGSDMSVDDIAAVISPFTRGPNTARVSGLGLGLTIVATVAEQHGGRLWFEAGSHGLRACLEIRRT